MAPDRPEAAKRLGLALIEKTKVLGVVLGVFPLSGRVVPEFTDLSIREPISYSALPLHLALPFQKTGSPGRCAWLLKRSAINFMPTIIGRFFFKLTTNGNLLGEYSNNKSTRCVTEAANRIFAAEDAEQIAPFNYEASYESVWRESANHGISSNLKIEGKKGCPGIYSLLWKALNGKVQFEGGGMLCDDVLIGNYWSVTS